MSDETTIDGRADPTRHHVPAGVAVYVIYDTDTGMFVAAGANQEGFPDYRWVNVLALAVFWTDPRIADSTRQRYFPSFTGAAVHPVRLDNPDKGSTDAPAHEPKRTA